MTQKKLLISYFPLFYTNNMAGSHLEDVNNLNFPSESPPVSAVGWAESDDGPQALVIMKDAKAVFEHLRYWCEEDYSRFKIGIKVRGDKYAFMIVPDINKSIQRYKTARMLFHDDTDVFDDNYTVYFGFLGTVADFTAYSVILNKYGPLSSVRVGFIDIDDVDYGVREFHVNALSMTGPIDLVDVSDGGQYAQLVDDMFKLADEEFVNEDKK